MERTEPIDIEEIQGYNDQSLVQIVNKVDVELELVKAHMSCLNDDAKALRLSKRRCIRELQDRTTSRELELSL